VSRKPRNLSRAERIAKATVEARLRPENDEDFGPDGPVWCNRLRIWYVDGFKAGYALAKKEAREAKVSAIALDSEAPTKGAP